MTMVLCWVVLCLVVSCSVLLSVLLVLAVVVAPMSSVLVVVYVVLVVKGLFSACCVLCLPCAFTLNCCDNGLTRIPRKRQALLLSFC